MNKLVDDLIEMNQAGLVLELCEKYYDNDVVMLSNGNVFAESMREAYDKQKGYVDSVVDFNVKLISKVINGNVAELIFHYKMKGADGKVSEYSGKHIQTWKSGKIINEEFLSL